MGEIYYIVTKKCLEAGLRPVGTEMDAATNFQRGVLEKLESCKT